MATKNKFRNAYSTIGKKTEYFLKYKEEDKTDQSQHASASIREMAKKYGIDALKSKAEKLYIESLQMQDQLYGNDFTKMQQSKEEMLNVKKKITNLFENIPARLRKEIFNDNIQNFLDSYTSNDLTKLNTLKNIGLISETQYMQVENRNNLLEQERKESQLRKQFIDKLNTMKEGLYENFKNNGDINFDNIKNNSSNN